MDIYLLKEILYALGEADINTRLALKYEDRKDIKEDLNEDIKYFNILYKKILGILENE